jgi:single-strand DNA-binding protein
LLFSKKKKDNKIPAVLAAFSSGRTRLFERDPFCFRQPPSKPPFRRLHNERETTMARTLNKVELIGHLGKDPEIRSFQNGGKAASFSIATSESWKDKAGGDRKERTEWHRISILNEGLVTVAEKYLKKGSKVYIEGKLETRKWTDKDGQERYTTEIVLRPYAGELILLDARDEPGVTAAPNDQEAA